MLDSVGERVKAVRESMNMTQAEFSDALNISRSNLANLEKGRYRITDRMINDICREFNVNAEWLTEGRGEMFRELTKNEKVAAFIGEALADEPESFRLSMIELLADLEPEDWTYLEKLARQLANKMNTKKEDSG